MRLFSKAACFTVLALAICALPVKADTYMNFDLSGQGVDLQFALPQTFTPDANVFGTFFESNVQGTVNGQATIFNLDMGSFLLVLPNFWGIGGPDAQFTLLTPGLFSWSGSQVTLYEGTINVGGFFGNQYTLTSTVATPEPASLLLLGMGGLSLLGFRLRRRTA
jgi:hypothetical protein